MAFDAQKDTFSGDIRPEEVPGRPNDHPRVLPTDQDCDGEEVDEDEESLDEQAAARSLVESGKHVPHHRKEPQAIFIQHVQGEEIKIPSGTQQSRLAERRKPFGSFDDPEIIDPFDHHNAIDPFGLGAIDGMDGFYLDWTPNKIFDRNRLQVYRYMCLAPDGTESVKYLTVGRWSGQRIEAPVPNYFWRNRDVSLLSFFLYQWSKRLKTLPMLVTLQSSTW